MPQVHINYLAVLVATVVAFVLGGLWYSPILFAKPWVKAHGYTEERVKEMQKSAGKAPEAIDSILSVLKFVP